MLTQILQTILENPGDDLPRMVYADWLEDHASSPAEGARAEFIRLQLILGRGGLKGDEAYEVLRHCRALHAEYAHQWVGPEAWWQNSARQYHSWARGWLSHAEATGCDCNDIPAPTPFAVRDLLSKTPLESLEAPLLCSHAMDLP
jgi:uncharacterized protein (TIGR02996 family)